MRELTKSMVSCTLAMSVFSVRQLVSLFMPREGREGPATADAFNQVAAVAAEQLGQTMRATFQAGDRWQRQMIDMIFSPSVIATAGTGKWISKMTASSPEPQPQAGPAAPVTAGAPAPSPPTWSWGTARAASGATKTQAPQPGPASSSQEQAPSSPPPEVAPKDGGQETGWGPMP